MFKITITPVEEQASKNGGGHAITGEEQEFHVPDLFVEWLEKALSLEPNEDGSIGGRLLRHGLAVDYVQV